MASLGTLTARINADTSQFTQGMRRVESRMKQTGKRMTSMGKNMSMKVTAPLAAIGGLGVKTAMDFEAAMNQVSAVSGATGGKLEKLEKQARDLGATTKFTATEAAEGMNFLAMAGFNVDETMRALPATLDLAAAGNMELGESADIVSNIMQGFQIQADKTREVSDVLAKTFTSSNTNLSQLGEAMSYVAPVAKSFGQSIESTSAAVGILSDAGMQASKAGTGLRRVFSTLATKSEEVGVQVFNAAGQMRPFADILEDLQEKGMSGAEAMKLFGMRGGPVMMNLMAKGADGIREFTDELENAGGTTDRVASKQMEGLKGALTELQAALSELAISFTEEVGDSLENFVDSVKGAMQWLSDLDSGTKRLIISIAGIAAAIGPVLVIMGVLVSQVGNLIKAIRVLNTVMKTTKAQIGGLVALVGLAAAGFIRHKKAVDNFNVATREMADAHLKAKKNIADEKAEVETLIATIKKETTSRKQKAEAFEKLRKLAPDYFGDLEIEKGLLEELTARQEDYNEQLMRTARIEAYKDKLVELYKELDTLETEGPSISFWNKLEGLYNQITGSAEGVIRGQEGMRVAMDEYQQKIGQTEESINRITNEIIRLNGEVDKSTSAFAHQAARAKKNAKLTLDLSGSQEELQERLKEVRGRMIELAAANEPIPPRLQEMAKAYAKRLGELSGEQDDATEAANKFADSLGDSITNLESLQSKFTEPIIPPEQAEQAINLVKGITRAIQDAANAMDNIQKRGPQEETGLQTRESEEPEAPEGTALDKLYAKYTTLSEGIQDHVDEIMEKEGEWTAKSLSNAMSIAQSWEQTASRINDAIERTTESVLVGFGTMLGGLIAGTEQFGSFGDFILNKFGSLAITVGKLLIQFGVAMDAFQKSISNPWGAIAAGIALIAIGTAITSKMQSVGGGNGSNQASSTTGMQGLATGGEVVRSGAFVVGEEGEETVHLPKGTAVTPNSQHSSKTSADRKLEWSVDMRELRIALKENEEMGQRFE